MPKCVFNKVAKQLIEIKLWYGCYPVNLLHIFEIPFPKNTSGRLLLYHSYLNNSFTHFNRSSYNTSFPLLKVSSVILSPLNKLSLTIGIF